MHSTDDSTRILRTAAWIWLGFLFAMALMDFALYTPQIQKFLGGAVRVVQNQPAPPPQNQGRNLFGPVYLFYSANGLTALLFLVFAYWGSVRDQLREYYYLFMLVIISAAPIVISALIVPRFPQGPLSNAEGMALRQLPVLFVALALVAWKYQFAHVVLFSFASTTLELGLIILNPFETRNVSVY